MPYAFEMPMPSDPVLAAMNGVSTSGWPGSPANGAGWCSRSKSSFSSAISSEYSAGASWPFDEKYHVGAGAAAVRVAQVLGPQPGDQMSVELKLDPMWPDPAFMIM